MEETGAANRQDMICKGRISLQPSFLRCIPQPRIIFCIAYHKAEKWYNTEDFSAMYPTIRNNAPKVKTLHPASKSFKSATCWTGYRYLTDEKASWSTSRHFVCHVRRVQSRPASRGMGGVQKTRSLEETEQEFHRHMTIYNRTVHILGVKFTYLKGLSCDLHRGSKVAPIFRHCLRAAHFADFC